MTMRIGSQSIETNIQSTTPKSANVSTVKPEVVKQDKQSEATVKQPALTVEDRKEANSKEKIQEAVKAINDFLEVEHKVSKFVFHDGLDHYFVKLIDAEPEEVIKEIPPEKLLDAFYEMQKLAGMIVDEKI